MMHRLPEHHEEEPHWMMSMLDMFSLLVGFFALMLSFSSFDPQKFSTVSNSMVGAFTNNKETMGANAAKQTDKIMEQMMTAVTSYAKQNKVDQMIYAEMTEEGLKIVNNDPYLFKPGQAELDPRSQYFIKQLVRMFKKLPFSVKIQGFTDNVPIQSARYSSNWELSASRAAGIVDALEKAGLPGKRFTVMGYGSNMPIASNESEKGRAKNRRIVILLEKDEVFKKVQEMIEAKKKAKAEKANKKKKKVKDETSGNKDSKAPRKEEGKEKTEGNEKEKTEEASPETPKAETSENEILIMDFAELS